MQSRKSSWVGFFLVLPVPRVWIQRVWTAGPQDSQSSGCSDNHPAQVKKSNNLYYSWQLPVKLRLFCSFISQSRILHFSGVVKKTKMLSGLHYLPGWNLVPDYCLKIWFYLKSVSFSGFLCCAKWFYCMANCRQKTAHEDSNKESDGLLVFGKRKKRKKEAVNWTFLFPNF